MDFDYSAGAIPESDMRGDTPQQSQFHYSMPSDYDPAHAQQPYGKSQWQRDPNGVAAFPSVDFNGALSSTTYDFSQPDAGHDMLADHSETTNFSHFGEDEDFAAALANYQPCDDCTPATKTTIPHHHHPSGRLAGASATLDGHFCCSWLTHGQPCFLCFQSAEALDNHIKNDHAGKDGTYRCLWQDCSKHDKTSTTAGPMNFGNKPKLMRHVHSHTGYKPFPCPYPGCDKGFVTKEQLKNHETTHTKSRKYKCDQCGKAFAVKSALTTHITAVHEEKKTHRCDLCGKAFADSSNLSKHKQTHYRDAGVKKHRSRRANSSANSTRSSPSTPATPVVQIPGLQDFTAPPPISPNIMGPPAIPKLPIQASASYNNPFAFSTASTTTTTSSPPPSTFDPNCYCCEQRCPAPDGPATPCNEADDCDRDGFCDLPECLGQDEDQQQQPLLGAQQIEQLRNFQMPSQQQHQQWDERAFLSSQLDLDEQFGCLHGS